MKQNIQLKNIQMGVIILLILVFPIAAIRQGTDLPLSEAERVVMLHPEGLPQHTFTSFTLRPAENVLFDTDVFVTRNSLVCDYPSHRVIFVNNVGRELPYLVKRVFVDCTETGGATLLLTDRKIARSSFVFKHGLLPMRDHHSIVGMGFDNCGLDERSFRLSYFSRHPKSEYQRSGAFLNIWYNGNGYNDVADICACDVGGPLVTLEQGESLSQNTRVTGMLSFVRTFWYFLRSATSYSYVLELTSSQFFVRSFAELVIVNADVGAYMRSDFNTAILQLFPLMNTVQQIHAIKQALTQLSDREASEFASAVAAQLDLFCKLTVHHMAASPEITTRVTDCTRIPSLIAQDMCNILGRDDVRVFVKLVTKSVLYDDDLMKDALLSEILDMYSKSILLRHVLTHVSHDSHVLRLKTLLRPAEVSKIIYAFFFDIKNTTNIVSLMHRQGLKELEVIPHSACSVFGHSLENDNARLLYDMCTALLYNDASVMTTYFKDNFEKHVRLSHQRLQYTNMRITSLLLRDAMYREDRSLIAVLDEGYINSWKMLKYLSRVDKTPVYDNLVVSEHISAQLSRHGLDTSASYLSVCNKYEAHSDIHYICLMLAGILSPSLEDHCRVK